MYKRDTKVMYRGEQWYYIGQDHVGDHLLSKEKGYTGPNSCTNSWFGKYVWTWVPWADEITLVGSPLENAIEEVHHMYELKRGDKVSCQGREWYYVGVDNSGDHLMRKDKGYDGPVSCCNWDTISPYQWAYTNRREDITLIEELITPSPLENAIEEYKREHGIVGTRPFKVPQGYPSTWLRFNGSTLEYEHINGWNKALASNLCDILFNTDEFQYLKGDEPRMETPKEWTPKIGDKVRILPRKDGQEDVMPCYVDKMTKLEGSVHTIIDTFAHINGNGNVYFLDTIVWKWRKEWLEHVE